MLVVITGGPYSGKTTLVEALGQRGYATVPEAAIAVIAELNLELGIDGQRRWRQQHRPAFQTLVAARQVANERRVLGPRPDMVFLDRGRLDGIAYCRHFAITPPDELLQAVAALRYDAVFVLDTLAHVHVRTASGRTSDRAESLALRDALFAVYREGGYDPVLVPEQPVAARIEFVLDRLGARRPPPTGPA